MKHIAIIGAGIAGLSCAYELKKKGYTVTVYEKESHVGGRMSTRTKNTFPMDTGANHLAHVYKEMRKYVKELDLTWEQMEFLDYRIFKHGKLLPLLNGVDAIAKAKLAFQTFIHKRHNTDFFNLSTAAAYDTIDAATYVKEKVSQQAHDYLFDPFVSTYQFHGADEMSLGAVYAMMRSHYNETKNWELRQLKGGMIALPQALANKLDMKMNAKVKEIKKNNEQVDVITLEGTTTYDAVVLATTADVTNNILVDATDGQRDVLEKTEYSSTIGVGFEIGKDLLQNITICWVPSVEGPISGWTNEAMKGKSMIRDGKTLVLTWFHENFAKTIINKTDEEIFEITKRELMKVCPLIKDKEQLKNYDLERWYKAMPKFKQGHLKLVKDFQDNHQGENNVWFAGDYLNAPWTEGALRNGKKVAEEVNKKFSPS
jgi:protoporphyrinogen/coproporphyrinogen III oxidase